MSMATMPLLFSLGTGGGSPFHVAKAATVALLGLSLSPISRAATSARALLVHLEHFV